jgi:hypothetical protein
MEFHTGTFPYKLLRNDYVRLVKVLPGGFHDPLHCEILEADLNLQPVYDALSYVWGDPKSTVRIKLHGHDFPVTQNLDCALRYFRDGQFARIIWVDALCINQNDIQERNSQVKRMHRIYKLATTVFIWTGEERVDDHPLFPEPPMPVTRLFSRLWEIYRVKPFPEHSDPSSPSNGQIELREDDFTILQWIRSLVHFANRAWFTRLWVVQEAVINLEAEIVCGHYSIPWLVFLWSMQNTPSTFRLAAQGARYLEPWFENISSLWRCVNWYQTWRAEDERVIAGTREVAKRIEKLLLLLKGEFASQNPRDRLYAIMGLVTTDTNNLPQELISVDYARSESEVFRDLTLFLIQETQSLDVLIGYEKEAVGLEYFTDKPSWVPTWGANPEDSLRDLVLENSDPRTRDPANFRISGDRDILLLTGVLIGTIDTIGRDIEWSTFKDERSPTFNEKKADIAKRLKEHEQEILTCSMPKGNYKDVDEAISAWKYALFHTPDDEVLPTEHFCYDFLTRNNNQGPNAEQSIPQSAIDRGLEDFVTFGPLRFRSKRPFVLDGGHIGSTAGVQDLEVGDCAYMFQGASVPFLVRSLGDYFNFLGGCYIHGVMEDSQQRHILSEGETREIRLR